MVDPNNLKPNQIVWWSFKDCFGRYYVWKGKFILYRPAVILVEFEDGTRTLHSSTELFLTKIECLDYIKEKITKQIQDLQENLRDLYA